MIFTTALILKGTSQEQPPEQSNLQTALKQLSIPQTLDILNIKTIIINLLSGIDRNIIKSELPLNNITLRYGTSGIAWIYEQLFELTSKIHFRDEFYSWTYQNQLNEAMGNDSIDVGKDMDTWGLLEGFAGNLLIDLMQPLK